MGLRDLFKKKKVSDNSGTRIRESDNVGTRITSVTNAQGYWLAHLSENPTLKARTSYYYYVFPNFNAAFSAMEELSFIDMASDTNNLISTEPFYFGVYLNEKSQWEAMVMGKSVPEEIKDEIKKSFEKHGGTVLKSI